MRTDLHHGDYAFIENDPGKFRIFLVLNHILTAFTEDGLRATFGAIEDPRYVRQGNAFTDLGWGYIAPGLKVFEIQGRIIEEKKAVGIP